MPVSEVFASPQVMNAFSYFFLKVSKMEKFRHENLDMINFETFLGEYKA